MNTVNLSCSFTSLSLTFVYDSRGCQASSLNILEPETNVSSTFGVQATAKIFSASSGTIVKFFPRGLETIFPNLEGIQIYNAQLEWIEKEDLKPFKGLIEIHLPYNKLDFLQSDLFEFNPKLKKVNFESNRQLKYVSSSLLKPLTQLEQAYFQSCNCINSYAQNKAALKSLMGHIDVGCTSPEILKRSLSGKEIDELNHKNRELSEKLEFANIRELEMRSSFMSCDGNLDSATKNWLTTSKQLKTIEASNKDSVTKEEEEEEIDLSVACDQDYESNFHCKAIDSKIASHGTKIRKVLFDESYENPGHNEILAVAINKGQTLYLPMNLAEKFPRLNQLSVVSSGLFEISFKDFSDLINLTVLDLHGNKLREIPPDTFTGLINLTVLDLSHNNIEGLEPDVFKSLDKLGRLKLNHNLLTSITTDVVEGLKSLKHLNLQNNKLKFISANFLAPFTSLESVNFTSNVCINMSHPNETRELVEATIIDNCIAPVELNCKADEAVANESTCWADGLAVKYPKTKILNQFDANITTFNVINQSINFLPFELYVTFPNLAEIVVERSKLTSLQRNDFKHLSVLKKIVIRYNNLTMIEAGTVDDVAQLEHLDLSFNNIQSLPVKIFAALTKVKTLILSENLLEKFTADLLPRKNAIEEFRIDHNQLEMIETKTLRFLRRAKLIDLSGNNCIDMKFDKAANTSRALVELSGEIDLNCNADD